MNQFSVVIVCRNEEAAIGRVLQSLRGLTDDVLVYDNGSTDGTIKVLQQYGVNVHQGDWLGYGKTKNKAVQLAKHDWVLSIDADEALDEALQNSLRKPKPFRRQRCLQTKIQKHFWRKGFALGRMGSDEHIRLFNRSCVNWNDADVHESLLYSSPVVIKKLPGYVLHRTVKDTVEYSQKTVKYALLNAEKYFARGKKSSWLKRYVSPGFAFVKHYFFALGFLDGWEGFVSARMTSFYTFLKYARLHELWKEKKR